jgi:carbon monoxide dehydrogenase subunit G
MELHGEQLIRAPRQRVWDALNDAQILAKCIPGCEEMNKLSDTETEVRLLAKIGPVRARFSGPDADVRYHSPLRLHAGL